MKVIKKEIELIGFEDIQNKKHILEFIETLNVEQVITKENKRIEYSVWGIPKNGMGNWYIITEQTYNELLEHLGWGEK